MKKYKKSELTPAKKKFAQVYAITDNATQAVKQAYPEITKDGVARVKGHRLLTNANVEAEIVKRKQIMSQNANRAARRIQQLIESEKEDIALRASIFSYEQEEGKAIQQITSTSTSVGISIDLTAEDIKLDQ